MRHLTIALVALGLAACGGGSDDGSADPEPASADDTSLPAGDDDAADDDAAGDDTAGDDDAGSGDGGDVVNPQPAGQAFVSVDGLEYTMQEPGALECTISDESITFSFRIGDNEVTLGAGANLYEEWLGNIQLVVANPAGEAGPIGYSPDLAANGSGLVIDGSSASYSGPMQKQPANDGTNPPAVDVGDGIFSVTCP